VSAACADPARFKGWVLGWRNRRSWNWRGRQAYRFSPAALRIDERGGEGAAAAAAETLLRLNPDIDALCVPVDALATGVLDAARALGRPVPQTLRLATRYDGMRAKLATPQLTAVDLHLDQVADAAIDMLISAMDGKSRRNTSSCPATDLAGLVLLIGGPPILFQEDCGGCPGAG
jgi:hypothetical protein